MLPEIDGLVTTGPLAPVPPVLPERMGHPDDDQHGTGRGKRNHADAARLGQVRELVVGHGDLEVRGCGGNPGPDKTRRNIACSTRSREGKR